MNRAIVIWACLFAALAVVPTESSAQERLGFALHYGTLVPHAGLAALSRGPSLTLDGELPLDRTLAIGVLVAVEHPSAAPPVVTANPPPHAYDHLDVFPLFLPFLRAYGPGSGLRPFALAGIGYAGLSGELGDREFDWDTPYPTAAVGGGVQWWAARALAFEITYRFEALWAKGATYTYSTIALGGRFRLPAGAP